MELTKIFGALCGSLLALLLIQTGASAIIGTGEGGHYGDHENAYVIEVESDEPEEEATEVAEVSFTDVYASADAGAGERLYRACAACHKLEDGANGVGPHLHNIVGRTKGVVDGFAYSDALGGMEGDWSPENLSAFLLKPADYVPGTKMSYNGMRDVEDRANLIAYLESLGG
ncbi:MAG: cytochrome c family protein [Pseudomonadota bacterium]